MNNHPCHDKCPNFSDEQCSHCLLKEVEAREFQLGLAPDKAYLKTESSDLEGCAHHPKKCCECMLKEIDKQYLDCISDEIRHLDAALLSIREVS